MDDGLPEQSTAVDLYLRHTWQHRTPPRCPADVGPASRTPGRHRPDIGPTAPTGRPLITSSNELKAYLSSPVTNTQELHAAGVDWVVTVWPPGDGWTPTVIQISRRKLDSPPRSASEVTSQSSRRMLGGYIVMQQMKKCTWNVAWTSTITECRASQFSAFRAGRKCIPRKLLRIS